ncbi:MAG: iron ABC transporter permease [Deinococcus sp.]|nr:iron ABC transporter permease [Deinococcus sp.]
MGFLALFFLFPLFTILRLSLGGEQGSTLLATLGDRYYLGRLWFTAYQALLSTGFTLVLALPSAFIFARYQFPGRTLLRALTTVPFVMPALVVALGFLALAGPQGLLTQLLTSLGLPPLRLGRTLWAIILAHGFYNYAVVVRLVGNFLAHLDQQLEEAARTLGARPGQVLWRVTLPLLASPLCAAALLVFTFCFTSFGVVLILGGQRYATLEVSIYILSTTLDLGPAAALALVQMLFTYWFMVVYARLQGALAVPLDFAPEQQNLRRPQGLVWGWIGLNFLVVSVIVLGPLLGLVARALTLGGTFTGEYFQALFAPGRTFTAPWFAALNSLRFALGTVALALPLGTILAHLLARSRSTLLDAVTMLPLGTSAVTLGLGFLLGFARPPLDLRGSWLLLVIAHSLLAYPFVVRAALPVLQGLQRNLVDAARTLGATPARAFSRVQLPLLAPALLVGATFAFAVSMGEFGATLVLRRPEYTTLPIAIYSLLGRPGLANLGQALAMSCVLMAACALGFVAIERTRYRGLGGF